MPVTRRSKQRILEVELAQDSTWRAKHLSTIRHNYAKAPHLEDALDLLTEPYDTDHDHLAGFNIHLLERVIAFLGIRRKLIRSSTLGIDSTGDERLIELVKRISGDTYLSGKGGENYQDPAKFAAARIDLNVMEYQPIAYDRGNEEFTPGLSIIDPIAWQGRDTVNYLRYGHR